jgi:dethiobiotin synthetase
MKFFVSANGTDSGKTVVCALLAQALQADYWKPVQAGEPTDAATMARLSPQTNIWPETYRLAGPMSPHAAARMEGVEIRLAAFKLPQADKLIVEGAGGLLVPLTDDVLMADLIAYLGLPVVLVCDLYLGSINHSLLTLAELKRRGLPLAGLVFNGPANEESTRLIARVAGVPVLFHLPVLPTVNDEVVQTLAAKLAPAIRLGLGNTLDENR